MWKVILIITITSNIWWNFQSYFSTIFYTRFEFINLRIKKFYISSVMWSLNVAIALKQSKIVEHEIAKLYDDIHNTFHISLRKI